MQNQEILKTVICSDCSSELVVVNESYQGEAYCTKCFTNERFKRTNPELYKQAMKEVEELNKKQK